MTDDPNVWALLLKGDDEAIKLADNAIAAAIGADNDPTLLTSEIAKCVDYVFKAPADEQAGRFLRLVTAFTGVSRALTGHFAELVVEAKEDDATIDDNRNAQIHFLALAVQALRHTRDGTDWPE